MLNMNEILLDFLTDSTMPAEKELIIIIITKLIYINNDLTNMNNNPKSTKIFANDEAAGSIIKRFRLSCFHSKLERWKQKL